MFPKSCVLPVGVSLLFCTLASADPLPPSATYRNLPTLPFDTMLEQLGKVDGRAFDSAYIRGQDVDHQRTAQLYEWIIDNGQDQRLASYAMETLPVVLRHLEMAKALQAQLTGAAP